MYLFPQQALKLDSGAVCLGILSIDFRNSHIRNVFFILYLLFFCGGRGVIVNNGLRLLYMYNRCDFENNEK